MTVRDYLDFMGSLRQMTSAERKSRADYVIERLAIGDYVNTFIGRLSKGFRQRVGLAQAMLHEPTVLILDEPTIGIDPVQVVETRELIRGLGQDHTIVLSTHILPEVSTMCERVVVINEGRIVAVDKPENLSGSSTRIGAGPRRSPRAVPRRGRPASATSTGCGGSSAPRSAAASSATHSNASRAPISRKPWPSSSWTKAGDCSASNPPA